MKQASVRFVGSLVVGLLVAAAVFWVLWTTRWCPFPCIRTPGTACIMALRRCPVDAIDLLVPLVTGGIAGLWLVRSVTILRARRIGRLVAAVVTAAFAVLAIPLVAFWLSGVRLAASTVLVMSASVIAVVVLVILWASQFKGHAGPGSKGGHSTPERQ
jgi:hypothetical protein